MPQQTPSTTRRQAPPRFSPTKVRSRPARDPSSPVGTSGTPTGKPSGHSKPPQAVRPPSIYLQVSTTKELCSNKTAHGNGFPITARSAYSGGPPRSLQDGPHSRSAAGPNGPETKRGSRQSLSVMSPIIMATGFSRGTTGTGLRLWSACASVFPFSMWVSLGLPEGFHGFIVETM